MTSRLSSCMENQRQLQRLRLKQHLGWKLPLAARPEQESRVNSFTQRERVMWVTQNSVKKSKRVYLEAKRSNNGTWRVTGLRAATTASKLAVMTGRSKAPLSCHGFQPSYKRRRLPSSVYTVKRAFNVHASMLVGSHSASPLEPRAIPTGNRRFTSNQGPSIYAIKHTAESVNDKSQQVSW